MTTVMAEQKYVTDKILHVLHKNLMFLRRYLKLAKIYVKLKLINYMKIKGWIRMPRVGENIIKFFNKIFKVNSAPMIANVTKQNYDEYRRTYDTLSKIFSEIDGIDAYLIGGISAAIQTNQDLYRQNSDIDIMCKEWELSRLIETLQKIGYSVDDRRGIKTRNGVDVDGHFQARDHELNANVCNLTINFNTHRPIFGFLEKWISDTAIDISNPNQMRGVDEVKDVTSLLEHYTILCDIKCQGIGIKARQLKSKEEGLQYITEKINDGSVRNINQETGINNRDLLGIDR